MNQRKDLICLQSLVKHQTVFDLCSDVLNSEECQTKSFSLLNVCFFRAILKFCTTKRLFVYHSIWQPKIGEELKFVMELNNIADTYVVCEQKNETIVAHLPKGNTGRFTKTISFLRADEFSPCVAVVNGNRWQRSASPFQVTHFRTT